MMLFCVLCAIVVSIDGRHCMRQIRMSRTCERCQVKRDFPWCESWGTSSSSSVAYCCACMRAMARRRVERWDIHNYACLECSLHYSLRAVLLSPRCNNREPGSLGRVTLGTFACGSLLLQICLECANSVAPRCASNPPVHSVVQSHGNHVVCFL